LIYAANERFSEQASARGWAKTCKNGPVLHKTGKKPEKTCGNVAFPVDKACKKPQGKRRKVFSTTRMDIEFSHC
jgi:hypothetical protein